MQNQAPETRLRNPLCICRVYNIPHLNTDLSETSTSKQQQWFHQHHNHRTQESFHFFLRRKRSCPSNIYVFHEKRIVKIIETGVKESICFTSGRNISLGHKIRKRFRHPQSTRKLLYNRSISLFFHNPSFSHLFTP